MPFALDFTNVECIRNDFKRYKSLKNSDAGSTPEISK